MADDEEYTVRQLDNFHVKDEELRGIGKTPRNIASPIDQEERDASLKAELKGLKRMNAVIEGILSSLERAEANMGSASNTISNSNQLLDLWVRILSQSEHTQRLVLSPHWEGGNKDLEDEEAEADAKLREEERKKAEERERQAERERAAAAAAAAREAEQNRPPSTSRGSGRGIKRSGISSTRGGSSTSSASRTASSSVASNRTANESSSSSGNVSRGAGRGSRGLPRPRGVR